jgi:predicted NBD/HSP70 family sugar kinase
MPIKKKIPRRVLVLDVGGSHVKLSVTGRDKVQKIVSGRKMSAIEMVEGVRKLVSPDQYDAVSIGYPGLVVRGRIAAEPFNLGPGWVGFDFEAAFGKPVRIINDAAMQAVGSYSGGRMLFLGLGTGMGATLILDGVVEPMEIGHLPFKHGRTFEEYVGERGLERLGKKKWRKVVAEVVEHLSKALEVDYVVLGGGNARLLKKLPKNVRLGDNSNAMVGGRLIWEMTTPLAISPKYMPHRRDEQPAGSGASRPQHGGARRRSAPAGEGTAGRDRTARRSTKRGRDHGAPRKAKRGRNRKARL